MCGVWFPGRVCAHACSHTHTEITVELACGIDVLFSLECAWGFGTGRFAIFNVPARICTQGCCRVRADNAPHREVGWITCASYLGAHNLLNPW